MTGSQKKQITVLEISYEVCNKVGGIYTVITSKIARMMENIQNYIAVGPYYEKPASLEFEKEKPPLKFQKAFNALYKKYGINCYYGRWLIQSQQLLSERPLTILIDPAGYRSSLNKIKADLWEFAGVDSMGATHHYDEPLPFSRATGLLLQELIRSRAVSGKVVAHFHEWLTGAGLLYVKASKVPCRTVFITHSTALGRTIAGSGKEDIYSLIREGLRRKQTVSDDKAREYGAIDRHTMERAACQKADVFTTVSDIVGTECEFILGRKPDIILHNGLDMSKFPVMEDISDLHIKYRNEIRKFVSAYFSPYYPIDVSNTIFYFISGRFEFHNKGVDLLLESAGRLNKRLKRLKTKKNIVLFIWVPCNIKGRHSGIMDNLALFEDLEEAAREESRRIAERIMNSFSQRKKIEQSSIIDQGFLHELKKAELSLKRESDRPPSSPFILDQNQVTESLESNNLLNSKDDKVKVIYYPTYLSSTDGMLGQNYYDAMMGCHVGIFPSQYESWGYTPLEAAALGCQSITTDLTGYGRFMKPKLGKGDYSIMVVPREKKSYQESVAYLEDLLFRIYNMSKRQRVQFKIGAKQLSKLADWSSLIRSYLKAYDLALSKRG
jgi:glycogen(starch) synthase